MIALQRLGKKLPALVLVPLLLVSGAVAPVLDRELYGDFPVLEAEHEPGSCVIGHDHTLCVHAGAGSLAPAPATAPRLDGGHRPLPLSPTLLPIRSGSERSPLLPRAPPLLT